MKKTRTTIPLEDRDREAIAALRDHYGVTSDVDAIRIALREVHRQINKDATPTQAPNKERHSHPTRLFRVGLPVSG